MKKGWSDTARKLALIARQRKIGKKYSLSGIPKLWGSVMGKYPKLYRTD